jgi:hypothetical protein
VCEYHRRIVVRELLEERDDRGGLGLPAVEAHTEPEVSE